MERKLHFVILNFFHKLKDVYLLLFHHPPAESAAPEYEWKCRMDEAAVVAVAVDAMTDPNVDMEEVGGK